MNSFKSSDHLKNSIKDKMQPIELDRGLSPKVKVTHGPIGSGPRLRMGNRSKPRAPVRDPKMVDGA